MSHKLSFVLLSLFILPLLAGFLNVEADCCDNLVSTYEITSTETPVDPVETTPFESDCFDCCGTCYGKLVFSHNSYVVSPTPSYISSSFDYSFSRKSSFISTPDKPPRT